MTNSSRQSGTILRLPTGKPFGFIRGTDGQDYFFHSSSIANFSGLGEGEAVTFEPVSAVKGLRAEQVRREN